MKTKIYLRVARGGKRSHCKVDASSRPNYKPLGLNNYKGEVFYPTVSFAINIEIPDELFRQAEQEIANIIVGSKKAVINTEILTPSKN